jgi:hypothetical protein
VKASRRAALPGCAWNLPDAHPTAHGVRHFPHDSFVANEFAMLVLGLAVLKVLRVAACDAALLA